MSKTGVFTIRLPGYKNISGEADLLKIKGLFRGLGLIVNLFIIFLREAIL